MAALTEHMLASLQKGQSEAGAPLIEVLLPGSPEYTERRKLRAGALGFEHVQPAGIAVPRDASEVAALVRWANDVGIKFTVRGGGNDFWARCIAHDALAIDMREINSVDVSADRRTAVIGGGVIARDLVIKLDELDLMTPTGNTWIIGYAGWMSNGGYGPFTHAYGMGIEQVLGAQLVNAKGEQVVADEEMLEGVRGVSGLLGVITSLTIKVYPKHDPLGGALIFESSNLRKTITSYLEAAPRLPMPKELTVHHFVGYQPQMKSKVFMILWTWTGPNVEDGQAVLQAWKDKAPQILNCAVEVLPEKVRQARPPIPCPHLKGGQRNCFLARLPTAEEGDEITAAILDAADAMPEVYGPNIAWGGMVDINPAAMPPNCFVDKSHSYFSSSYGYPSDEIAEAVDSWCRSLIARLRSLGEEDVLDRGYPATHAPGELSAEELYGEKWSRVKELKAKYDPTNVFSHAYPKIKL
ncbi:d-lactate dehydrogenase [Colletotrichum musicola]|uniref:D-lactate dehydrogenase n=1 Tax=Colletotrichum musicola TaxID=2175873 RepID=A0A8H6KU85_9PEZI|nr:d-lactate dehydrogenase [Colletotrichum musicola]